MKHTKSKNAYICKACCSLNIKACFFAFLLPVFVSQVAAKNLHGNADVIGNMVETVTIPTAQQTVSGTVVDVEGVPLPGASIVEKGTSNGAQSDFDGNFTLEVADQNAVLVVSYVGYATKEVSVANQTQVSITLE